jgi:hypothetical protein
LISGASLSPGVASLLQMEEPRSLYRVASKE